MKLNKSVETMTRRNRNAFDTGPIAAILALRMRFISSSLGGKKCAANTPRARAHTHTHIHTQHDAQSRGRYDTAQFMYSGDRDQHGIPKYTDESMHILC